MKKVLVGSRRGRLLVLEVKTQVVRHALVTSFQSQATSYVGFRVGDRVGVLAGVVGSLVEGPTEVLRVGSSVVG